MTERSGGRGLAFTNPKVQRLRRLAGRRSARDEERVFVVEGPLLIGEAIASGWSLEAQFVAPGTAPVAGPAPVWELATGVLERIVDVASPRGVVAVVHARPTNADAVLAGAAWVLVADRVGDPGNLGTILRSAEAAGVDAVAVTPGTVDPFAPKVVRASAGSVFHVPIVGARLDAIAGAGLRVIGTSSHRGTAHTAADWGGRVAIVVGNEAHGLDSEALVDTWVRIEHHGRAESLNVAMAATILCFEAARARGNGLDRRPRRRLS